MPTVIVFDPQPGVANTINGANSGVSSTHDAAVTYDGIYFSGGNDTVWDTDANGWIWGQAGSASGVSLYGFGGNDVLLSFDGADYLDGGSGNDILIGNGGNDLIVGGLGDDQLWGGDGADTLDGGAGSDWIIGGGGGTAAARDVLAGGLGDNAADILIGSHGSAESFVVNTRVTGFNSPLDTVWYFNIAEDRLRLSDAGNVFTAYGTDGRGLTGTFIAFSGASTLGPIPIMFLAGVNVDPAQLAAAGAIEYV